MLKLIIWDLDDTLWSGTLADGEAVRPFEHRLELIRAFNARGVLSSICSKNDFGAAKAKLVELGIWDELVFPEIAFLPKGEVVRSIISNMQLRPANVLFVDDNPVNLAEARFLLPDLQTLDIRDADADLRLTQMLAMQPPGRNRVAEYRVLEAKHEDRAAAGSPEDFLRSCAIRASAPYLMDNLDFVDRLAELLNRSNQLNYTGSRTTPEALRGEIIDVVAHDSWSIFAWDRYGDYGLVGFAMLDRRTRQFVHFTFSCRIMHMGIEAYAFAKVREKWPDLTLALDGVSLSGSIPDWIEDCSFHDQEVRQRLVSAHLGEVAAEPALRIMFDCQSGGVAHFSRHRRLIDFDNNPRLFALRSLLDGSHADQAFPPYLVYGAGIDYSDPRWPGCADRIDGDLYAECVRRMCAFIEERGSDALIVLPPEDLSDAQYRPHMGHTRDRTCRFNAIWRDAAKACSRLTLVEISALETSRDAVDVSHYHPTLLRELSARIDDWYEARRSAERLAA